MKGWLYSKPRDLAMLGIPLFVTSACIAMAARYGDMSGVGVRAYAAWMSQFILGNSTHVILTFVLLGLRRDVLHATKGQATTVIAGSTATFALSFLFFWITSKSYPSMTDFGAAVVLVFATHHTLSQAKGIWALYAMRARKEGLLDQNDLERKLQRNFVSIGLVLILVRWLFVQKRAESVYPFIQAIPGEPAILPYFVTYVMLALWIAFAAVVIVTVARKNASTPKIIYVCTHLFGVGFTLASPGWGAVLTSGIHGLEYYVLCGRMLAPTNETERAPTKSLVWPLMLLTMAPLAVVGILNAPFTPIDWSTSYGSHFEIAKITLNSIVMAHYFADAFIYRFRIPEVRRVALTRLGFA